jgi:multiple sugar transport system ATP-binding protein
MAQVHLEHVRKVYPGGVEALSDVTFQIDDGQYAVLVGPSGCGKTTALRLVAGLEEADAGTIRIGDRVVNDVAPKDRDIAMVFQNYALYPHMTVRQNMGFALKLRRMARADIRQRVGRTAGLLGIEGLLSRRPRQLSGGQRQRVALGRAIVREPKAFLFDEPLSNLDAALRVTTRAELKRLHMRLGTTTIHVTHDQEEAMTLGERIVVMSEGRVQQIGPAMEVFENPANRFVATFIGMPPMNMIEGRLERRDGSVAFVEAGEGGAPWTVELPERLRPASGAEARVALGVRAQALEPAAEDAHLTTRVEVVEPLGDQADVIGHTPGGHRLVARCASRARPTPGSGATWRIDWAGVHLFAEDGSRLSRAVES